MDTPFTEKTCEAFVAVLSSAAPVPGGGGAAALVGAVGTALGAMAGNLTVGRKKYAAVEEDIRAAVKRAEALQKRLLELVEMCIRDRFRDAQIWDSEKINGTMGNGISPAAIVIVTMYPVLRTTEMASFKTSFDPAVITIPCTPSPYFFSMASAKFLWETDVYKRQKRAWRPFRRSTEK